MAYNSLEGTKNVTLAEIKNRVEYQIESDYLDTDNQTNHFYIKTL